MDKEIKKLIPDLVRQKRTAQERLLTLYGQMVFRLVTRIVERREDAEEVYQDVFIKVFKNINMYDAEKSSLKTWISHIAYNESISFLRHKSMPVIYYEDREGEAEKLSDAEVEATFGQPNPETVQLIRAALKHLPPDERAIITMFYYEQTPSCSIPQSRWNFFRAFSVSSPKSPSVSR